MHILKLTVAYEGTRFVGWQRQAEGTSIQGLLETALARLEGAPVTAYGAGRTDAGVHALAQVASAAVTCAHDNATILRAVNAQLPEDVRVIAVEDAEHGFHARFHARGKTYRYAIVNARTASPFLSRFAWHVAEPLNTDAMAAGAAALVGAHDFAAFQSTGTVVVSSVRTVTSSTIRHATTGFPEIEVPPVLLYEVTGDGFLRHMVRAIVGTLVDIGRGQRAAESIESLLASRSRHQAGATAPAHGLFLVNVQY